MQYTLHAARCSGPWAAFLWDRKACMHFCMQQGAAHPWQPVPREGTHARTQAVHSACSSDAAQMQPALGILCAATDSSTAGQAREVKPACVSARIFSLNAPLAGLQGTCCCSVLRPEHGCVQQRCSTPMAVRFRPQTAAMEGRHARLQGTCCCSVLQPEHGCVQQRCSTPMAARFQPQTAAMEGRHARLQGTCCCSVLRPEHGGVQQRCSTPMAARFRPQTAAMEGRHAGLQGTCCCNVLRPEHGCVGVGLRPPKLRSHRVAAAAELQVVHGICLLPRCALSKPGSERHV